jgi:glycosyltransferase involved in cell wall biosynthesis
MTNDGQPSPRQAGAQPLVSIITPTYNHEAFIGPCIESVLSQTYPLWEQVIIDDGSTDGTQQAVAKHADRRIKYLRQDNLGIWNLAKTYNRGLNASQGQLVAVLEGDDYWPPNKLERQVSAFDDPGVVLSWGRVRQVNARGRVVWKGPRHFSTLQNASREETIRRLLFDNFVPACTVMCRRDALISAGGFKQADYTPYVDHPTWLELSLLGRFAAVDEVLGYWRCHVAQMSAAAISSMYEGTRYSVDFLQRMPQDLARSIGVQTRDLAVHHQHQMQAAIVNRGRIALINRDWGEARSSFRQALMRGTPPTRLMALIGLACACCRTDAEWAATLAGRRRFK